MASPQPQLHPPLPIYPHHHQHHNHPPSSYLLTPPPIYQQPCYSRSAPNIHGGVFGPVPIAVPPTPSPGYTPLDPSIIHSYPFPLPPSGIPSLAPSSYGSPSTPQAYNLSPHRSPGGSTSTGSHSPGTAHSPSDYFGHKSLFSPVSPKRHGKSSRDRDREGESPLRSAPTPSPSTVDKMSQIRRAKSGTTMRGNGSGLTNENRYGRDAEGSGRQSVGGMRDVSMLPPLGKPLPISPTEQRKSPSDRVTTSSFVSSDIQSPSRDRRHLQPLSPSQTPELNNFISPSRSFSSLGRAVPMSAVTDTFPASVRTMPHHQHHTVTPSHSSKTPNSSTSGMGEARPAKVVPDGVSSRMKPLYILLADEELTYEIGVEGVKEWVEGWLESGVRVRDLSKEVGSMLKGPLGKHKNVDLIHEILVHPTISLLLPPNIHRYPPLLDDLAFFEISKRALVDCLVDANRRATAEPSSGEVSRAGSAKSKPAQVTREISATEFDLGILEDQTTPNGKGKKKEGKRLRSNSGGDLAERERQYEEERQRREYEAEYGTPKSQKGLFSSMGAILRPGSSLGQTPPRMSFSSANTSVISLGTGSTDILGEPGAPNTSDKAKKLLGIPVPKPLSAYDDARMQIVDGSRSGWKFFKRKGKKNGPSSEGGLKRVLSGGRNGSGSLGDSDTSRATSKSTKSLATIFFGLPLPVPKVPVDSRGGTRSWQETERLQTRSMDRVKLKFSPEFLDTDPVTTTRSAHDTVSRSHASSSGRTDAEGFKLKEQQVAEVLVAYIYARLHQPEVDKRGDRNLSKSTKRLSAISLGKDSKGTLGRESSLKAPKSGQVELERINKKLGDIKFDLICQCGNNTHSVIQSALNKVRFNLGYVLPTTLVNRLTSLQQDAEVDYLGRTVEHQLSAANRDEARVMMDAWLKVRWNLIDRWQLMKMAKDDILSKLPSDLRSIMKEAMSSALLPTTPFPPFVSEQTGHPHLGHYQAEMQRKRHLAMFSEHRDGTFPVNLPTMGGSTPNLPAVLAGNGSSTSVLVVNPIDSLAFNIISLPTVPNTRELLVEWVRRERLKRLRSGRGWWIQRDDHAVIGAHAVAESLNTVERECFYKDLRHLDDTFRDIRLAFLLPTSPILHTASKAVVDREMDRIRKQVIPESSSDEEAEEAAVPDGLPSSFTRPVPALDIRKNTGFEVKRAKAEAPMPKSILNPPSVPALAAAPNAVASTSTLPITLPDTVAKANDAGSRTSIDSRRNSLGAIAATALPVIEEDKQLSDPDEGDRAQQRSGFSSPDGGSVIGRGDEPSRGDIPLAWGEAVKMSGRPWKALSKMSEASSEAVMDMASIFATRDSSSRGSNWSQLPIEAEVVNTEAVSPSEEDAKTPRGLNFWRATPPKALQTSNRRHSSEYRQRSRSSTAPGSRVSTAPSSGNVSDNDETPQVFPTHPDSGEVSPFPKPASPPGPIPGRTTSLSGPARSPFRQPPLTRAPVNAVSPLRLVTNMAPVTPTLATPSSMSHVSVGPLGPTLHLVLMLFDGEGPIKPGLTPGLLEIELLKIVELERQKVTAKGKVWSAHDVMRLHWLIDEIQMTIDHAPLESMFARVRASLGPDELTPSEGASTRNFHNTPIRSTRSTYVSTSGSLTPTVNGISNGNTPPTPSDSLSIMAPWHQAYAEKGSITQGTLRLVEPYRAEPEVARNAGNQNIGAESHLRAARPRTGRQASNPSVRPSTVVLTSVPEIGVTGEHHSLGPEALMGAGGGNIAAFMKPARVQQRDSVTTSTHTGDHSQAHDENIVNGLRPNIRRSNSDTVQVNGRHQYRRMQALESLVSRSTQPLPSAIFTDSPENAEEPSSTESGGSSLETGNGSSSQQQHQQGRRDSPADSGHWTLDGRNWVEHKDAPPPYKPVHGFESRSVE